ncbi:MAG: hypothetical protein RLZZ22_1877 [Pseudomonadota bacterium]|jgi:hypothetical protein
MAPTLQHLIVPYAATIAPLTGQDSQLPALPRLARLLARLAQQETDAGDEYSLSPPHERALARALGLPTTDGAIPWAAWEAGERQQACAWFTPCHWQARMDQVTLQPPENLDLPEAESRELFEALRPWTEEDGIALHFESATRWRAVGPAFADLPWASLDRVAHRQLDAWLPNGGQLPQARALLRLQNEAQMLFYTHPLNDRRAARGLASINGFWISGTGAWEGQTLPAPRVAQGLRAPALRGDLTAWAAAWERLEQDEIAPLLEAAERGDAIRLTLCGERGAISWASGLPAKPGALSRLRGLFQRQRPLDLAQLLSQL